MRLSLFFLGNLPFGGGNGSPIFLGFPGLRFHHFFSSSNSTRRVTLQLLTLFVKCIISNRESFLGQNIIILSHFYIIPFTFIFTDLIDVNETIFIGFDITTFIKVLLIQNITRCNQSVNNASITFLSVLVIVPYKEGKLVVVFEHLCRYLFPILQTNQLQL